MTIQDKFRLRSINVFCLTCFIVTIPYMVFCLFTKAWPPLSLFTVANSIFLSVVAFNRAKKYNLAKIIMVLDTFGSVLVISLMLGFDSGFHIYIYTVPLFVFWLFDINKLKHIVATFALYLVLYFTIFFTEKNMDPYFVLEIDIWGIDLYSINLLINIILVFVLFYSYSNYYQLLFESLKTEKQNLSKEVARRTESENNLSKLYEDLVKSYNNLEQFSYVISHNLRAPMANIKGYLQIYDNSDKDPMTNQIIESSKISLGQMEEVVNDLNDILNAKKGQQSGRTVFSLNDMILSAAKPLQPFMSEVGAQLKLNIPTDCDIESNRPLVKSIFFNFISNSLKYRQPDHPPVIEISANKHNEHWEFSVKDNGLGLDLEKTGKKLFGLYQRFHPHIEGKGIGLFLIKSHIESLGGTIQADSKVNGGTTFTFTIKT